MPAIAPKAKADPNRRKVVGDEEYISTLQDFKQIISDIAKLEFNDDIMYSKSESGQKTLSAIGNAVITARAVLKKHDEFVLFDLHKFEDHK